MTVFELGCGAGSNLFAMNRVAAVRAGAGIDTDPEAIQAANAAASQLHLQGFRFALVSPGRDAWPDDVFDFVLLIDVLEHLPTPRDTLERVIAMVGNGGRVLVSVPTPLYPRVFGATFHRQVGHLVDGYSLRDISDMFGPAFRLVEHGYTTGPIASIACAVYYRVIVNLRHRRLGAVLSVPLHLARAVDWLNGPSRSCSLWCVYERALQE